MEPPEGGAGGGAEKAVLLRDGFHIFGFLLPFVWLLFKGLWIEAVIALALSFAIGTAAAYSGIGGAPLLSLLVGIYVGLEGTALRVAALRRRGWHEWGVVEAANPEDAEARYLFDREAAADHGTPVPASPPSAAQPARSAPQQGQMLGLVSYPERP